eukprot:TRINITY_DN2210_c0_g1_i4.p1 TRINITY_DN2210_c0_g1~~TRINITY_DN2210_c0_g1_i4.p1  ORF type:complete len:441 (+),score=120.53 TRINITY_DN2210_c0_g1_i4:346-1668(+)
MGCFFSTSRDEGGSKKKSCFVEDMAVFVPGLRIPKAIDFTKLHDQLTPKIIEQLSAYRMRIVAMAAGEGAGYKNRKKATQQGLSNLADLHPALEEYLPLLLGLTKEGIQLRDLEFTWVNQEDDEQETSISSAWYEVLSVLHMMAILSLLHANSLLLPKSSTDAYQLTLTEENKKAAIEIFLKAAGYLDCALCCVLPQISSEHRSKLPKDLNEGVLHALSVQALGQGVDIQLGLAIENPKATLAVKRRLACEEVKYWHEAQISTSGLQLGNEWGEKHQLFIKWKYIEAKAAAYYFHGLILDEGGGENSHAEAVACLRAAEQFLKESKKACSDFSKAAPETRIPPPWGAMKYLSEKIPRDVASKGRIRRDSTANDKVSDTLPKLPDFSVALKPDEYSLPPIHQSWNDEFHVEQSSFASSESRKETNKLESFQPNYKMKEGFR